MLAAAVATLTTQNHPLGQACALLAAVVWGYALVLFKRSGEHISPVALNLYKNAVGLLLLLGTLAVLLVLGPDGSAALGRHSFGEIALLLLSGVLGIAVADSFHFHALNLIGVGLISIVDCCYAPFVILFSWLLLGEKLTLYHYVGAALIVTGVFTASRHALPPQHTRRQIIIGILLAVLAIGVMAFGIVIAKPVLDTFPLLWATALRMVGGLGLLSLFAVLGRDWREHWVVFRPHSSWRPALPASILGAYVSVVLWVAGFKYTYASIAGVLNQTSIIFASILAALVLKEHFGRRQVIALVLALTGVVVTCGDQLRAALGW
jgi:drug/metabolite transporter (DMT)-like permease